MSFSKYVNLIFDTDKEDIYIYCDLDYFERIMLNLLSNSIKYSDNGCTITVSIHSEEIYKVLIVVEDNCIGIPDDKKQKIFSRFKKIYKSMFRKNEGSGMRLYIAKSLVELLNGFINLESTLGIGSKFYIRFPVVSICDEICTTLDDTVNIQTNDIIEKINIEFSDILIAIEKKNKDKNLKYEYKVNTNILVRKLKNSLVSMILEKSPRKRSKTLKQIMKEISRNVVPIRHGRNYDRRITLRANKHPTNKKRAL